MSIEKIEQGDELTQSKDLIKDNISKLKELFPEIITENKIDFKILRDVLGDEIEEVEEYYRFTWAGKSAARREAHKPSTGTLRPVQEESVDWDKTQNLYIEGDNLEVLKLLQKSYAGRIKMIYIDPPYNTGNDFIYKDDYKDNLTNYQRISGQIDSEGKKITTNSESEGRFHSNWLNMMYPRLKLSRNLLTKDGLIFISIDDNEYDNLKKICDEIFGENNFITSIIWEKRFTRSNNAKLFSSLTEKILLYRKSEIIENLSEPRNEKADSTYSNPDNDERGLWTSVSYVNPATKEERPNLSYDLTNPITGDIVRHPTHAWKYEKSKYEEHCRENKLYWGKDGNNTYPRLKKFLSEMSGMVPVELWKHQDTGTTDLGSKILEKLMGGKKVFDFPKPPSLISRMLKIATSPDQNHIVLDFFAGSSPSAQAILELNAEDNGNRKFIQVQLPELTDEKSEAFKCGYKTISEIGKERIRRAGKNLITELNNQIGKVKSNSGLFDEQKNKIETLKKSLNIIDIGFKVFKLDSSNIKAWDGDVNSLENSLYDSISNIKEKRSEEDVLFEILLKYGLDLALPIEEKTIEGKKVFNVGLGALFICLGDNITSKVAEGIGKWKEVINPEVCRVIFKDTGFTDVEKTNSVQTLKRFGIEGVKSI